VSAQESRTVLSIQSPPMIRSQMIQSPRLTKTLAPVDGMSSMRAVVAEDEMLLGNVGDDFGQGPAGGDAGLFFGAGLRFGQNIRRRCFGIDQ
jgi:hypothetical protein